MDKTNIELTNELIAELQQKLNEVNATYRKGCITPVELTMKMADLYTEYQNKIGFVWIATIQ
jgi:predicted transcriptional regulator